jgi:hypothetical protein
MNTDEDPDENPQVRHIPAHPFVAVDPCSFVANKVFAARAVSLIVLNLRRTQPELARSL